MPMLSWRAESPTTPRNPSSLNSGDDKGAICGDGKGRSGCSASRGGSAMASSQSNGSSAYSQLVLFITSWPCCASAKARLRGRSHGAWTTPAFGTSNVTMLGMVDAVFLLGMMGVKTDWIISNPIRFESVRNKDMVWFFRNPMHMDADADSMVRIRMRLW